MTSAQQAVDHERRQQPSDWLYGLLARRVCNFVADDGVLGLQMMPLVYYGGAPWCFVTGVKSGSKVF